MITRFSLMLLGLLLLAGCDNEKNKARRFNDSLMIHQVRLMEHLDKISEWSIAGKTDSLKDEVARTHQEVKASLDSINAITPYPGWEEMKEKMTELFVFYDDLFTDDYPRYLEILQSDSVTQEEIKSNLMQIQFRELQAVQIERELEALQDSLTQSIGIRLAKKTEQQ